ncbi:sensor histidine kinase [Mucilaginibacter sp. UR6-11]|uniref:sensor histidine kinase n=1 Tax=Mucilaginibacter sp. UR6-11 TaxID=1435644 RepID=UPI001E439645|nr:histidine kinase [Mucilaginibacter sp. UR6-11]MCC8424290.1 histidine kinase [Mucilaginibacter sp. UR6-11]
MILTKKFNTLILFLFAFVNGVHAWQSNLPSITYMRFDGPGLLVGQMKETQNGLLVTVVTAGGFIGIHPTSVLNNLSDKIYYRAYFNGGGLHNDSNQTKKKQTGLPAQGGQIYLKVNDEVFVDILDKQTNTLVKRYEIKRIRIIPKITLSHKHDEHKTLVLPSHAGGSSSEVMVAPGDEVQFNITSGENFKGLEVEYTLVNLKTKRSEYRIIDTGFAPFRLLANTEYELRYNYVDQQESVQTVYIRVKPYWYQSIITYAILITVVVAIGFLLVTLFLRNKIRSSEKKQKKLETAAIRLQSLLNPHFTFNALSSIQGLMNTDRIDEANNYLQEFSSLLRQTLANNQHVFNSLDRELEMMRMYVKLEALRFNFSWNFDISPELNISNIEIPTLLLQPLIENSVKHGLSKLGDKGELSVICKMSSKKDTFVIVVEDNGTWVSNNSGYGLSLTFERILTINKMTKDRKIELDFDKKSGTKAILTFHNWLNN